MLQVLHLDHKLYYMISILLQLLLQQYKLLENPGVEQVTYDSLSRSKPVGEAAQIAAALGPVIGKIFRVQMTARGIVQEVQSRPGSGGCPPGGFDCRENCKWQAGANALHGLVS